MKKIALFVALGLTLTLGQIFTAPAPVQADEAEMITISNVQVVNSYGGAKITWTSSAAGDSQFRYATSTSALATAVWDIKPYLNGSAGTAHEILLGGLIDGITYYYEIRSLNVGIAGVSYFGNFVHQYSVLPDLKVAYIQNRADGQDELLPEEIKVGEKVALEAVIANAGTLTSSSTQMSVYVNDVLIGSPTVGGIVAGGSGHNTDFVNWTPTVAGKYRLRFVIDPNNTVRELDETNNTYTTSITAKVKDDDDEDDDSDTLTICHYNNGTKTYVTIKIDQSGWDNGHSKHENDKIKTGDTCGTPTANNNDDSDNESELVKQLRARIAKLEYKISQFEQDVIEHERQLIKRINKALTKRLQGHILLQVENNGEAWYVDADSGQRYYLRNGESAFQALQAFGLGITNQDLEKIPVGLADKFVKEDSDGDGLPDMLEVSISTDPAKIDSDGDGFNDKEEVLNGYSPLGTAKLKFDNSLVNRLRGKILLQVEKQGQAWWINPDDGKRYYLKDGESALDIMKYLSTGITNSDIEQVDVGTF